MFILRLKDVYSSGVSDQPAYLWETRPVRALTLDELYLCDERHLHDCAHAHGQREQRVERYAADGGDELVHDAGCARAGGRCGAVPGDSAATAPRVSELLG